MLAKVIHDQDLHCMQSQYHDPAEINAAQLKKRTRNLEFFFHVNVAQKFFEKGRSDGSIKNFHKIVNEHRPGKVSELLPIRAIL